MPLISKAEAVQGMRNILTWGAIVGLLILSGYEYTLYVQVQADTRVQEGKLDSLKQEKETLQTTLKLLQDQGKQLQASPLTTTLR